MAVARTKAFAFAAIVLAALLHSSAAQTTYTVGGTTGWTIPQGGDSVYTNWAAGNSFAVGDVLVFNFAVGAHDVTQVNKAGYDACSAADPMMMSTTSPARVALNSTGEHYFICGFPGHCSAGQKVTVNVLASTTSSSPSPAPMMPSSPAPMMPSSPAPMMPSSPAPRRALTPASAPSPVSTVSAPAPSTSPVSGDVPSSAPAPSARPSMTYTVGDSFGWNIPRNATQFQSWAAGKDFMVGDILVFNYTTGAHNVAEVTSDAYTACTTASPISLDSNPPTRITLTTPGEHFYLCAIPGHCSAGQQLSINVTGAAGGASPSGAPASDMAPPSPNSAASVAGVSATALLSVFVALMF